ncbi:MAG: hypothetical protein K8R59_10345 [Thermoanaerobaculales bacterium]|nr:hypothetical protein [Thermoanaerobaculales bacterium]
MSAKLRQQAHSTGGAWSPPVVSPSPKTIQWLIGLRLVVISTLFLGILLIQTTTLLILPLKYFYGIILSTYGLSLLYIILYLWRLSLNLQAIIQLIGDIIIVTALVYFTGGLYSPFSFLYLAVIVAGATIIRGGALIFAGISAIAYGLLVDLLVFGVLAIPPNLSGSTVPPATPRVLSQILIHVVGFALVAIMVSYLAETLRTTRHRLEEEMGRSQRFAAVAVHVVRSVTAGILAVELDGRILHLNPAGAKILDLNADARVNDQQIETVMPLRDHSWGLLFTRGRAMSSIRIEDHHRTTGFHLGLTVGPLEDEMKNLVGYIINFQDLSEVEGAAQRRRTQERMAAVGEMAARMAHEIKNPLASISGSAQMLARSEEQGGSANRLLNILVDESKRLSGILDNFLDYSKPNQGSMRQCDLVAILQDCIDLLRLSEHLKPGHTIDLEVPEKSIVLGEEPLLRQMFWNLTRNALDAMPEEGAFKIGLVNHPGKVVMTFMDEGIGMSEEFRLRAFEPFVTATPGGTGLGLAVVYSAVEQHDGTIQIESAPGQGTTVIIEIPHLNLGDES